VARYWSINTAATAVPLIVHPSPLVITTKLAAAILGVPLFGGGVLPAQYCPCGFHITPFSNVVDPGPTWPASCPDTIDFLFQYRQSVVPTASSKHVPCINRFQSCSVFVELVPSLLSCQSCILNLLPSTDFLDSSIAPIFKSQYPFV